mgnify:CR=1 FL=1
MDKKEREQLYQKIAALEVEIEVIKRNLDNFMDIIAEIIKRIKK